MNTKYLLNDEILLSCSLTAEDSDFALKYIERIATDFGITINSPDDHALVWDEVRRMTSWNIKGTLPKSGRWFSWMESCQSFLSEWWASRMILEWYLGPNIFRIQTAILLGNLSN